MCSRLYVTMAAYVVGVMTFTAGLGLAAPGQQPKPERRPPGQVEEKLPETFTTPENASVKVISQRRGRVTVKATTASGVSDTITIVGPTVMEKGLTGSIIDIGIMLIEKYIGGSGGGGGGGKRECTQEITSTTKPDGTITTSITTKCTQPA